MRCPSAQSVLTRAEGLEMDAFSRGPLRAAVRWSLAGITVSVVLLGDTTGTQPYFYALMGLSVTVYLLSRGERLLESALRYLTSGMTAWRWAFVVWALLSLLWTSRSGNSADRAMTVLEIQVVGLVFFDAARNLGQTRWILKIVLACTVFGALYAVASGDPLTEERLAGVYRNPNTLGIIAVTGLAIYCAGINEVKRKFALAGSYVVALSLVVGILASSSLKGLAGGAFVCGIGMLFQRTRARIAVLVATGGAVAVALVSTIEPLRLLWVHSLARVEMTVSTLASSAEVSQSFMERARFIRKGVALIAEAPMFGRGLGAFSWLSDEHTYAHNNFVEVGVALGVIGLVLFYGFHASILARVFRNHHRDSFVGRFTIIIVLTTLLLDVASVSYASKVPTLMMIMCAGWLERPAAIAPEGELA